MTQLQIDKMEDEISNMSTTRWKDDLTMTDDVILLADLWPIFDKYIKGDPGTDDYTDNSNEEYANQQTK